MLGALGSSTQSASARWVQKVEAGFTAIERSSAAEIKHGLFSFYEWALDTRLIFTMLTASALYLSVGLGLAFQIFLGLLIHAQASYIIIAVLFVPVLVTVVALFVSEFASLGEAFMNRKLRNLPNLYISEAFGVPEHNESIGKTVIASYEATVLIGALVVGARGETLIDTGASILQWAMLGGITWSSVFAVLQLACKCYIQCHSEKRKALVARLGLAKVELRPFSWLRAAGTQSPAPTECDSETALFGAASDELHDPLVHFHLLSFRGAVVALVAALVMLGIVIAFVVHVSLSRVSVAFVFFGLFFPALALISCSIGTFVPTNAVFESVYGLFMVITLALVCGSMANSGDQLPALSPSHPTIFEPRGSHAYMPSPNATLYPICEMRWGDARLPAEARLTAIDLGVFATSVYEPSEAKVWHQIKTSFEGTPLAEGMELESIAPHGQIGKWAVVRIPAAKLRVVAVAGTHTFLDALADADLWATVKVMQTFSKFTSLLEFLPSATVNRLVGSVALRRWMNEPPLWAPVENAAAKAKKDSQAEGFKTVITGHSLGGGLSQILGAHLDLQVLGWSPVGIGYSLDRFGITRKSVFETSVVVKPDFDIVPEIDLQLGFTQRIPCAVRSKDPVACHGIFTSNCEFYCLCGDVRGRDMGPVCDALHEGYDWCPSNVHIPDDRAPEDQSSTHNITK